MFKSGLKWMFLIIGTTIGAGYASGRELWEFFGHGSGLAITLFSLMFILSIYIILKVSYEKKSTDYLSVLEQIVGVTFGRIYDVMIFFYLFTVTIVMIAGSGATIEAYSLSKWWGIIFIVVVLFIVFMKGINGLLLLNQYLIPFLIVGLLYILLRFITDEQIPLFSNWHEQHNWLAAFPFTALNILPLIAVLGAIGNKISSKKEIWVASIGSGLILGVTTYIFNHSLIYIADELLLYEIPLFAILNNYSFILYILMTILLWLAIFTTAAAGILGMISRLQRFIHIPLWILVLVILLMMMPLTTISFSTLIKYLYPAYGLLNLYVLVRIILYPLWTEKD